MRVVLLSEVFAPKMGYLENVLPKYLTRLGVETHVVTLGLPPYYNQNANAIYKGFADQTLKPGSYPQDHGFMVQVIPYQKTVGYMRAKGLVSTLAAIRPDVVQTTSSIGWLPLEAAVGALRLKYKLFTGNHYHSSVFPLASRKLPFWHKDLIRCKVTRFVPGRLAGVITEKCYAIAPDCAEIAARFFGVPAEKIEVCPLGVDTELFTPACTKTSFIERERVRSHLGFSDNDIVCIYTGRFTEDKNPLLLASAVSQLRRRGEPYRALFVGNGPQAESIQSCDGCRVQPFVPLHELPALFRASDVGVWPTQESTSMLDAAACGLPIVVNDTMSDPDRISGNGLTYRLNELEDLAAVLLTLKSAECRRRLGARGAEKMSCEYSWQAVAQKRLSDYCSALGLHSDAAHPKEVEEYTQAND